ncbi:hypothetical protein YC2023_112204 [Brassica napus]
MGDDSGSGNYYFCQAQVASALPHAGLESSNLIVGVKSFGRKSLHYIGTINPYQQAISIIGKTSSVFNQDNLIPCYGFRYVSLLSLRKVDSWSSLINGSRLSGHVVIVFAEEAAQELMCKNMNLTLMPLITSFLKMSASGYNKAPRIEFPVEQMEILRRSLVVAADAFHGDKIDV